MTEPTKDDIERLRDAALNVLEFVEETGCRCTDCETRIGGLRHALDPFLPKAADVLGILAERDIQVL